MSNSHVSSFIVTRDPFVPDSRVHVSAFGVTVTPPAAGPSEVHVSHFSVTIGLETPITDGATWFRSSGAWSKRDTRVRLDGGWQ